MNASLKTLHSGLARLGAHLKRGALAYTVLFIALLLTLLASYYVKQNVEAQSQVRFEEITQATQEAIERKTKAYLDVMLGARALFYASNSVTRKEWSDYVASIEPGSRFEGLQALSYAQRLSPDQREAFMREAREDGLPQMRPDLNPGGERSAYFPLTYTGPLDEANQSMLNYDLYAEEAHKEAMDQARDSGSPRATKMVYVLSEASPNSSADLALREGFVVYLPVYEEGEPRGSVVQRRRALKGFIVGSFVIRALGPEANTDDAVGLLDGIFEGSFNPSIDFEVYDGKDPTSSPLLYDRDGIKRAGEEQEKVEESLFSQERRIEVAGHEWSLYFATLPGFEEGGESDVPAFVLASGVGMSLILFGVSWMLVRSRTRAERTSYDLEEANKELETFYHSVEQELRMAQRIQHALLPKDLPALEGWEIAYHYQPAREVGGDFYDFLRLDDGRVGLVIGDVSGKGIAAALVMANTQSVLRALAQRGGITPGQVLAQANEVLYAYVPPNTFVTCFYAILDPRSGRFVYANAGHDLPCERHDGRVDDLRARGMPLGLMSGMLYQEEESVLAAGDDLLFYSDGLVEAHDPEGEMFGFPRLQGLVGTHRSGGSSLIGFLLSELTRFTGEDWEQEDDITLVTLQRSKVSVSDHEPPLPSDAAGDYRARRILADFSLPSERGNERRAMEEVARAVSDLGLPQRTLERLKTAVAEATMNAMEHGNRYIPEVPVQIQLLSSDADLFVRITDQGGTPVTGPDKETPDLEAKLEGEQTPRGWGLFLIRNMVDEMRVSGNPDHHTIELIMHLKGGEDAS